MAGPGAVDARYLRELVESEPADRRLRAISYLIIGVTFALVIGAPIAIAWLVLALAVVFAGEALVRRAMRSWPARRWRWLVLANLAASYLVVGAIAPVAAFRGGMWGLLNGQFLLTSLMLYANMQARRSRSAFFVSAGAIGLCMVANVVAGFRLDPAAGGAIALCVGTFSILLNFAGMHRRSLNAALAADRARVRAEAATAAKSAFVAMVSHELRTPISGILAGAAELETSAADPASRANAALILDSGRMMRSLLNDLLDLAKIEAGRMDVEARPFDLRRSALDTVRFWTPEVRKRGLRLRLRGAHRLPARAQGDPTRVRQVLNNLISNALKFTDAGSVTLRFAVTDGEGEAFDLAVEVIDTGPGMTPAQLGRLFQPFEQLSPSLGRTHGGTGLGLAISRELARLMGGDLTVTSAPGEGAAFRLTVPLVRLEPASPVAATTAGIIETGSLKVLIADDHEVNRQAFRLILEAAGAQVVTVGDGAAALALLADAPFDLVLMDLNMPVVGGLEAVRRLRAQSGPNARTLVIALTAASSPQEVDACLDVGMDAFVMKPVEAAELLAVIDETLRARPAPARSVA
jgi:signal transduction histidine kinase/CheY-like chemotaxis protein